MNALELAVFVETDRYFVLEVLIEQMLFFRIPCFIFISGP
jgi:hypothetical protein